MPAKKKTTKKKPTKKQPAKQAQQKPKVVYRTKKVYVERPQRRSDDDDPFRETSRMVMGGAGLMIGASILGGVGRELNGMGR
jgi:hypothetical protein